MKSRRLMHRLLGPTTVAYHTAGSKSDCAAQQYQMPDVRFVPCMDGARGARGI
jgi:hypothetical protein